MSTDLALRPQQAGSLSIGALKLEGMDDLARVAQLIAKSGMFRDAKTPEQVGVKMLFAMTMGFSPVAGLTGVDIIEGSPTPNAHFWAAAIEDSPLYDYEVKERTNERCTVAFSRWDERAQSWRHRGQVTWTLEDAKQAGLVNRDNWKKYPRAMLWARAMTEGGRTYCPGLFGGVRAYDPEELGSEAPPPPGVATVGEVLPFEGEDPPVYEPPDDPGGLPIAEHTGPSAPEATDETRQPAGDRQSDEDRDERPITKAQLNLYFAAAKDVPEEDQRRIVNDVCGAVSRKDIPRWAFEQILQRIEAHGKTETMFPEEQ